MKSAKMIEVERKVGKPIELFLVEVKRGNISKDEACKLMGIHPRTINKWYKKLEVEEKKLTEEKKFCVVYCSSCGIEIKEQPHYSIGRKDMCFSCVRKKVPSAYR